MGIGKRTQSYEMSPVAQDHIMQPSIRPVTDG